MVALVNFNLYSLIMSEIEHLFIFKRYLYFLFWGLLSIQKSELLVFFLSTLYML